MSPRWTQGSAPRPQHNHPTFSSSGAEMEHPKKLPGAEMEDPENSPGGDGGGSAKGSQGQRGCSEGTAEMGGRPRERVLAGQGGAGPAGGGLGKPTGQVHREAGEL